MFMYPRFSDSKHKTSLFRENLNPHTSVFVPSLRLNGIEQLVTPCIYSQQKFLSTPVVWKIAQYELPKVLYVYNIPLVSALSFKTTLAFFSIPYLLLSLIFTHLKNLQFILFRIASSFQENVLVQFPFNNLLVFTSNIS